MAGSPAVKPIEATNRLVLTALKAEPKPNEPNKYIGYCPVHETIHSNPSLLIYENTNGYLGFSCLSRKCESKDIVAAIKTKFGLTVPFAAKRVEGGQINKVVNYPAHESAIPLKYRKSGDTIYEYHCETGEVAFIVQRYLNQDGKKEIRPFFSKTFISDEGIAQKDWDATEPPKQSRPLYNLHNLYRYNKKPVIIVEGEKAADAAMVIPELKDFIITTWSGGTAAHKFTDWKPLKDRDTSIYFWPDNDAAGYKAAREILAKLSNGFKDTRFYLLDYKKLGVHEVVQGWDLADESASPENPYSVQEMLEGFASYITNEIPETGSLEEELIKREEKYRKLLINGKLCVLNLTKPLETESLTFEWYKTLGDLVAVDVGKSTIEITNSNGDTKKKEVSIAAQWYKDMGVEKLLNGAVFNPNTKEREIITSEGRYLNLFTGFPSFEGVMPNNTLVDFYINHISKLLEEPTQLDWLLDYIAHIFQYPNKKPGVAIILEGGQGTGKSTVHEVLSKILGHRLSKQIGKDIDKWQSVITTNLLCYMDEFTLDAYQDKKLYDLLKHFITSPRISINEKYVNSFEIDSFHRFIFTSNDEKPVNLPPDDRRFAILRTTPYWHNNINHFTQERDVYLTDPGALLGLQQWFFKRQITHNVSIAPLTKAKIETFKTSSRTLDTVINWCNGYELPTELTNTYPDLQHFGSRPVRVPIAHLHEVLQRMNGNTRLVREDMHLLWSLFGHNGADRKLVVNTLDRSVGSVAKQARCYLIPPFEALYPLLEKAAGYAIKWNHAIPASEAETDDSTNVIELAKRDSVI